MKKAGTISPLACFLLAQIQLSDDGTIALDILVVKVAQQPTAMSDHLQRHFLLNGRRIDIPSIRLKPGDILTFPKE